MATKTSDFAKVLKGTGTKVINNNMYISLMFKTTLNVYARIFMDDDTLILYVLKECYLSDNAIKKAKLFCTINNINYIEATEKL